MLVIAAYCGSLRCRMASLKHRDDMKVGAIYMAWIGTLIVGLVMAAPELLKVLSGSIQPNYLLGVATARLIFTFFIAAIIVFIVARGSGGVRENREPALIRSHVDLALLQTFVVRISNQGS